ncbi:type III PLP-dependent enzyme [Sphaerisporangium fuscum]|uniref:type III PLP-dependent enzyme n=1 Tax=Sphaerisporangium fuscum TaxID=2835868 RepID=UPI001BDD461C|nr:type III PLP-dependent enzyme [Sphaerisporangium fuscum]
MILHSSDSVDVELVGRYGSPIYVYQLDAVAAAVADLRAAIPAGATLYYSLKANPHPAVARELRKGGCHAEISSEGELAAARAAGFSGADCLYTGPAKSLEELSAALAAGVTLFSVESAADYGRVARAAANAGTIARCLLRISGTANGGAGLRMTGTASQFGVDAHEFLDSPDRFADFEGARVVGAHFFPVSNVSDEEGLAAELEESIATAARLRREGALRLEYLDLGGGFAAPYAKPGNRPNYPMLRRRVSKALDAHLPEWRDSRMTLAFESGRHLVGDCGRLICCVVDVKDRSGRTFVLLDSGINHLGGLSGLGRMLPEAVPVLGEEATELTTVTLAGPLCTPADVISRSIDLARLRPGDLIVFPNLGAYGLTASLIAFLGRPSPTEVVLRGDVVVSASRLRLTRETLP